MSVPLAQLDLLGRPAMLRGELGDDLFSFMAGSYRVLLLRVGQRMQDVDRPADVETASVPAGCRSPRTDAEAVSGVSPAQRFRGIVGDRWRRRNVRKRASVGSPEFQAAVGLSFHRVAVLVHGAMVSSAEQRQVRQRRGTPVGPVLDVMSLADPESAPWKAAAMVSMLQRAP